MFYHFTSRMHHDRIVASGVIFPSESNVGSPVTSLPPWGPDVGPRVVWLLDTPYLRGLTHGLDGSAVDKTEMIFAVDVPAVRWLDWAPAAAMNDMWRSVLIDAGGGLRAVAHWHVWPAPIYEARWRHVGTAAEVAAALRDDGTAEDAVY